MGSRGLIYFHPRRAILNYSCVDRLEMPRSETPQAKGGGADEKLSLINSNSDPWPESSLKGL